MPPFSPGKAKARILGDAAAATVAGLSEQEQPSSSLTRRRESLTRLANMAVTAKRFKAPNPDAPGHLFRRQSLPNVAPGSSRKSKTSPALVGSGSFGGIPAHRRGSFDSAHGARGSFHGRPAHRRSSFDSAHDARGSFHGSDEVRRGWVSRREIPWRRELLSEPRILSRKSE
jgi:hypothetical protein